MARGRLKGRLGALALAVALLAVAGGIVYAVRDNGSSARTGAAIASEETTGSIAEASRGKGDSGLAVPRFVSLKTDRVNVRRGPSSEHQLSWVFMRKGLPVEIIAEFEHWRRVRDSDGAEGWVYHSLLSGRRTVIVAPWNAGRTIALRNAGGPEGRAVAMLAAGVVGEIESCDGDWCRLAVDKYEGFIEQAMLWGVYPGEHIDD